VGGGGREGRSPGPLRRRFEGPIRREEASWLMRGVDPTSGKKRRLGRESVGKEKEAVEGDLLKTSELNASLLPFSFELAPNSHHLVKLDSSIWPLSPPLLPLPCPPRSSEKSSASATYLRSPTLASSLSPSLAFLELGSPFLYHEITITGMEHLSKLAGDSVSSAPIPPTSLSSIEADLC